jgi:hypothetical protein
MSEAESDFETSFCLQVNYQSTPGNFRARESGHRRTSHPHNNITNENLALLRDHFTLLHKPTHEN